MRGRRISLRGRHLPAIPQSHNPAVDAPSSPQRRRLYAIFIAASALSLIFGGGAFLLGLRMHRAEDRLLSDQVQDLLAAQRLQLLAERKSSVARRYFLTGEAAVLGEFKDARAAAAQAVSEMQAHITTPAGTALLGRIGTANEAYDAALAGALAKPRSRREYLALRDKILKRSRSELFEPVRALVQLKRAELEAALSWATVYAHASLILSGILGPSLLLVLGVLGVSFRKTLQALEEAERDLAEAKESLERTVERRTLKLSRALRLQEEFGYSVAHDLRGPARAVAAYSELLLRRAKGLDDEARRRLQLVADAAGRLRAMLDALLELTLLAQRRPVLEDVDLAAEARSLAAELAARHPERRVSLKTPSALPARADRELVRVLLRELLDNAWKFARGKVEVGTRGSAFFVTDDGEGFDPAFVDRLFKPFHRLRNAEGLPGLGVGLTRADRAAEAHGGRLWAEGLPGGGATFCFTLAP